MPLHLDALSCRRIPHSRPRTNTRDVRAVVLGSSASLPHRVACVDMRRPRRRRRMCGWVSCSTSPSASTEAKSTASGEFVCCFDLLHLTQTEVTLCARTATRVAACARHLNNIVRLSAAHTITPSCFTTAMALLLPLPPPDLAGISHASQSTDCLCALIDSP
jgi:hypothetical protein